VNTALCTATLLVRKVFQPRRRQPTILAPPTPRISQPFRLHSSKIKRCQVQPWHASTHVTLHVGTSREKNVLWKQPSKLGFRRSCITSPYVTSVTCLLPRVAFFCDDAAPPDIQTPTFQANLPSPTTMLYIILPPTTAP